ncbi:MAG: RNA methyltransferase [Gammaproteobacteria bacterium]|nr:RNA methyltransferase [Gammaproteobacteria bacterium]
MSGPSPNVRIVLVNTTHPGNIGAVARAMKNMGLRELYLVDPKVYPSAEATARASGADDVLADAVVCADLKRAIADCPLVIGASARTRAIDCPRLTPRECVTLIAARTQAGPAAVVFGREHSGLSNAELDRCHFQLSIPVDPGFPSLNIAAAVQIFAYEYFTARVGMEAGAAAGDNAPVPAAEMERFYLHLEQILVEIGFLDPARPRHLMRRLRRLYNRAEPDQNEMNILRGILTAVHARCGGQAAPAARQEPGEE